MTVRIEHLLPLVARIQADPEADASLAALAEQVGLSPFHLQRVFARMIGESPKRIASRIALERAAAALIATSDSILDIALDSGFDSHEGFTRAFRRHFDTTPAKYRERGLAGAHPHTSELAATHREIADHVAPCVGLYGTRLAPTPQRRSTMTYTITKKTLSETPILYMRRRVQQSEIGAALGELLPGVYAYAMKNGIPLAGQPVCRYCEWSNAGVTLEAGIPVATPAQGEGDVLAGALQAGSAATTVHVGPYDSLHGAHAAIEAWLGEHALKPAGDPWEVYVTDPGEVPNPAEWQTEVVWPTNE